MNEIIPPDVAKAADYISKAWRDGIESIIETGRRLVEIRQRWHNQPGKWSQLIGANEWKGKGLLPFHFSHCYRLIAIAECERLFSHVRILPSDSYTLYQLTRLTKQRFAALVKSGVIHPGMKRNEASAETRRERKTADEQRVLSLVPAAGKYRTLLIDPPWDYEWLSIAGRAAPGYATMTHDELLALDVESWAESDSHLYLCTTNNFLTRAVDLMAHWGFAHKTILTWVKPGIGLGSYFRNSTEHILFGVRGELSTRRDNIATHFEAPLGEHSEKPERLYEIIRAASYPPFGEIFQRTQRPDFVNLYIAPEVAA